MMDFKVKVTFADGSRRVLKNPSELTKANKRREIRVVFKDGKYIDLHLGRVCPKLGIVKVNTFGLLPEGIKLEKIIGWCYKFPHKTSKRKKI